MFFHSDFLSLKTFSFRFLRLIVRVRNLLMKQFHFRYEIIFTSFCGLHCRAGCLTWFRSEEKITFDVVSKKKSEQSFESTTLKDNEPIKPGDDTLIGQFTPKNRRDRKVVGRTKSNTAALIFATTAS